MTTHVKIIVGDEPFEKALRRFKKTVERLGLKKELKDRNRYEKPSDVARKERRKRLRDEHKSKREQTKS